MKLLTSRSIQFLKEYVNTSSPTGYEMNGQHIWLDYIQPYVDEYFQDLYYNTVAIINPNQKYKVAIEAHADEISWMVNFIDDDGFIHVLPNGGADPEIAPGKHIEIHTDKGSVHGVFGWPAIHLRHDIQHFKLNAEHLFIDIGCTSKKEALRRGVRVGNIVTFKDRFRMLNKKYFLGRALDNRIGGLIIAETARILYEDRIQLPYTLFIVNSTQEEVGLNGAKVIADRLKPDIAIVTDVTHDTTTPFINRRWHGYTNCGSGPVLAVAPSMHKAFLRQIKQIAERSGIPYQLVAVSRETGTDADAIALSRGGICSALISPPLRYMHTPVEMVNIEDVENCIRLMVATLRSLRPGEINPNRGIKYYNDPTPATRSRIITNAMHEHV
jgi:putative aminopeptidase FrvX